jgi:hypothetical protein
MLFTAAVVAQDTVSRSAFEGVLHIRYQTIEEVQFIEMSVKRERIRIDAAMAEPGGTFFIVDYQAKKRYVILPHREQYIELPATAVREDARQLKEPVNFTKTDSSEGVAGYPCDLLLVNTDAGELKIWATKKLGTSGTLSITIAAMIADESPWEKEMIRFGYFPLKVIMDDGSGEQRVVFEATSIDKKALGEARFAVPTGYEKTTVEALTPKTAPQKKKAR